MEGKKRAGARGQRQFDITSCVVLVFCPRHSFYHQFLPSNGGDLGTCGIVKY